MVSPSKYDYFGYPLSMLVFGGTTPSFQKVFEEWDCSFCQNYIWGLLFIDPVTWLIWLEIQVSCLNMSPFETNIWQDVAWCSLFRWWTPNYPRTLQVFPSYNWPTKNTFQQKTPSKANNLRRNPWFFFRGFSLYFHFGWWKGSILPELIKIVLVSKVLSQLPIGTVDGRNPAPPGMYKTL